MAEAFFRKYAPKKFKAISAGTDPSSQLNSTVIKAMKEIGIDFVDQTPKPLSDEMVENSFKIINMGCMTKKSCSSLYVNDVIDWNISDPKAKSIEEVRQIRDQIKTKVMNLINSLEHKN